MTNFSGSIQMSNGLPIRTRPVHGVLRLNQPTVVFVTVCTKQRRPILANHHVQACIHSAWELADSWRVGRYVIMPDHVHVLAGLLDQESGLERWVRYWKSLVTRTLKDPGFQWQAGYWDTRMRNAEHYESKWEYVKNNPVRHGLVEHAMDWPYAGVISNLGWD